MVKQFGFGLCLLLTLGLFACASNQEKENAAKIANTNVQLAVGYLKRGKYDVALSKVKRALDASWQNVDAHSTAALIYEALGKNDQADDHYQTAIELAPESGAVYNNYGVFLCKQKKYKDAVEYLVKAAHTPRYPTPEKALENAGACARQIPDYENAEEYLREALRINPKLAVALYEMAQLSFLKNKPLSVRAYLQRYEEVASHTPQSLWLGIVSERKLGDRQAVDRYAKQLQTKFPDSAEFKRLLDETEQQRAGS